MEKEKTSAKRKSPFTDIFLKLIDGMTQQQVADKVGVSRQNVGLWIKGTTVPDIFTLPKIADAFNVSTDYLLGRSGDVKSPDTNLIAACKYTGLSETAIRNIHKLQMLKSGDVLDLSDENKIKKMQNQIKTKKAELKSIEKKYPQTIAALNNDEEKRQLLKLCLSTNKELSSDEKLNIEKELLSYPEFFNAFSLLCDIETNEEEISNINEDSKNRATSKTNALNKLLSDSNFFNFLQNLAIYIYSDFDLDNNLTAIVQNKNFDGLSYPIDFSTKILESAVLTQLQDYLRNLKEKQPDFFLCDFEAYNSRYSDFYEGEDEEGNPIIKNPYYRKQVTKWQV